MATNKSDPVNQNVNRKEKEKQKRWVKSHKDVELNPPKSFSNQDDFTEIFNAHYQKLFSFLFFFVNNRAIAEELTQEVFLRLYQYTKDGGEVTLSWLYSVARNLAIDWKRKNFNRLETNMAPEQFYAIQDQSISIVEKIEIKEAMQYLEKAIVYLDDREREIFLLRIIEQLKYNEIAKLVNISERNIKRIMRTALRKVVHYLHENT